jgi:hypothetical protein
MNDRPVGDNFSEDLNVMQSNPLRKEVARKPQDRKNGCQNVGAANPITERLFNPPSTNRVFGNRPGN